MSSTIKKIIEITDNNNPASVMHDDPREALSQVHVLALGLAAEAKDDPAELWAEIHRLRSAVQGPDGYATWQEAATAERVRRVKAERAPAWIATEDESPPVGERVFWLDAQHNMVGYDTYIGEPYRFNASHWMRIPKVYKSP